MSTPERVLVALSGGVDSSVAALLLQQQGVPIVGAYMKNWINEDNVIGDCPWQRDIEDARAVCDRLGIEFRIVNLMQDYRRLVVDYLLDGYQRGLTPNPDVMCNSRVKFGVFRAYAQAEGFSALATGHYARRIEVGAQSCCALGTLTATRAPQTGGLETQNGEKAQQDCAPTTENTFSLLEGSDKNKDQSYFLALLSQEQLRFARFPIGHLEKTELRHLAREAGLPTAAKKDSQGICFIGEVKMADFLKAYVPERPGPIVRATDGVVLGGHRGLHYYTIGQRRGIRIPSNTDDKAYVVTGKRPSDHALLVAFDDHAAPGLWTNESRVLGLSYITSPITVPCMIEGRVRYRDPRVKIEFIPDGADGAIVKFAQPQRGIASGQILALYDGEVLLGGGVFA